MCTVHMCARILWLLGLLLRMSHVYRTHVCTDSLVARVTIGRKGAPLRMSHSEDPVHMCTRRTPCTHVCNFGGPLVHMCAISEDPRTHVCNFGGPPVHMCTRRTPRPLGGAI